jgi:hypothetical protein
MPSGFYRIRNWENHFETSESRKRKGSLSWVSVTTKHDGKTFRRLMKRPDAARVYGAWILILAVAAKCPIRGDLVDDDGPLSTEDLESKTGLSSAEYDYALQVLTGPELRWIEHVKTEAVMPERAGAPAHMPTTGPDITGHNKTGPDTTGRKKHPVFKNDWNAPDAATLRDTQGMLAWLDTEGRKAGLPDLSEVKTRVIAAAERALDHGSNKPRLFGSLIRDLLRGDHEKLTGEYMDRAKQRLRGHTETNGHAAQLAAKIGVDDGGDD